MLRLRTICRPLSTVTPRSFPKPHSLRRSLFTKSTSTFSEIVALPSSRIQIYLSRSHDPYYNLSLEQYLVNEAFPQSTILLLYTNDPCVVLGRYQNPWVEVDHRALRRIQLSADNGKPKEIPLLRRRSGGGTVFHDRQNLNYCVIWPASVLDRMKHAKVVTRAIRKFNPRARVNERHDIVLDHGSLTHDLGNEASEEVSGYEVGKDELLKYPPLKVSGSAFRQTKGRALHHGTCLVCSKNLQRIGTYLRSPGREFIKAGGAESVRSPVGNVFDPTTAGLGATKDLALGIIDEFRRLYGVEEDVAGHAREHFDSDTIWVAEGCTYGHLPEIFHEKIEGMSKEPKSYDRDWIYGKTGQISRFTVSSHHDNEAYESKAPLPRDWPNKLRVSLAGRYGEIIDGSINVSDGYDDVLTALRRLEGRRIHGILSFEKLLVDLGTEHYRDLSAVGQWLDTVFGK